MFLIILTALLLYHWAQCRQILPFSWFSKNKYHQLRNSRSTSCRNKIKKKKNLHIPTFWWNATQLEDKYSDPGHYALAYQAQERDKGWNIKRHLAQVTAKWPWWTRASKGLAWLCQLGFSGSGMLSRGKCWWGVKSWWQLGRLPRRKSRLSCGCSISYQIYAVIQRQPIAYIIHFVFLPRLVNSSIRIFFLLLQFFWNSHQFIYAS